MGCAASRFDDLPLVSLCRERKDFIKAAAYHRYALAASHVSYFQSLEGVGEALRKFTDQELGIGVSPSNSFLVTIPSDSDEGEKKQDSSLTHSASVSHYQSLDEGSHSSFASSFENNSTPDGGDSNPTISKTKYSAWDFLTQFASVDRHGVGSVSSGIDSMDDEIKEEIMEEVRKGKQKVVEEILSRWDFGEGTSKMVQSKSDEENMGSVEEEIRSCSESIVSTMRRPLLVLNEFEIASNHGKEVAVMLEVWKSYHPRSNLRVIASRILHLVSPSILTSSHLVSRQSQHAVESILKMAKDKYGYSVDIQMKSGNLSSTLEILFAWEEKLYKAVKDEEKFRIIYERKCKRLEILIARKAPNHKIDAIWASAGKLLTKIDIATKTAEVIVRRMDKLRDEELEPQITKLIEGLTRMWKSMLKCHEKQFQAIIESISRGFLANTSDRRDSSMRATFELEIELHNWCIQFILLVNTQKAYVESLNMWLLKWMLYEPEETPNRIMPFSPGRVGAPPVFIICNDWCKVMERFSETEVVNTMRAFALSLHQLWESQDVEQRQRLEAENLFKDLEQQLQSLRLEEIRTHSYGSIRVTS